MEEQLVERGGGGRRGWTLWTEGRREGGKIGYLVCIRVTVDVVTEVQRGRVCHRLRTGVLQHSSDLIGRHLGGLQRCITRRTVDRNVLDL